MTWKEHKESTLGMKEGRSYILVEWGWGEGKNETHEESVFELRHERWTGLEGMEINGEQRHRSRKSQGMFKKESNVQFQWSIT